MSKADIQAESDQIGKRDETFAFVFLAFVLFPGLAVAFVGGLGFIIWMQQLVFGPPGV